MVTECTATPPSISSVSMSLGFPLWPKVPEKHDCKPFSNEIPKLTVTFAVDKDLEAEFFVDDGKIKTESMYSWGMLQIFKHLHFLVTKFEFAFTFFLSPFISLKAGVKKYQ